jgi:hypothetical protein
MNDEIPSQYTLKNTSIGWWIDGPCGYLYVGYFKSKKDALDAFWERYRSE